MNYRYAISLRLFHPDDALGQASYIFGINPSNSWIVGRPRKTPRGEPLDGVRSESFWTARLLEGTSQDRGLSAAIAQALSRLARGRDFLKGVSDSGGRAELFIGWFFDHGSSGDVLGHALLRSLADLRIDLSFDVYGDVEELPDETPTV